MPSTATQLRAIYPLNEAIRRRLEEKRREREEAARQTVERIAEIQRRERLVAQLMVDWLAQNEGVEVDPDELSAVLCHDGGYRITWRRDEAYVELLAQVTLHEDLDQSWVEVTEPEYSNAKWKGFTRQRGMSVYAEYGRFVDAVIYALGLDEEHYPISIEFMEV
ncbi:MAG TPA: hypothetical protein G4O02_16955 [Caldilineae bacterium]|nr:hypothetical protein [Caldilineae bacterium]